jgi:hypothetical protein
MPPKDIRDMSERELSIHLAEQHGEQIGFLKSIAIEGSRNKWLSIGIIGSIFGVKVVGSPFWLDAATIVQCLAWFIGIGVIFGILRKNGKDRRLTSTGWWFIIFLGSLEVVSACAFMRDTLGLDANIVWMIRTASGLILFYFMWNFYKVQTFFKKVETHAN